MFGVNDWNEQVRIIKKKDNSINLDDLLGPVTNYDLDEIEIIGDHIFSAAVPFNASKQFKKNVLAAMKAYSGGYKSIDRVLKRFGDFWEFRDPSDEKRNFYQILREVKQEIESVINEIGCINIQPDNIGHRLAREALVRLKASFRSSTLLISQGYFFEPMAICKLILEQIAWSYSTFDINNEQKIRLLKPTKTISHLKKIIPYIGNLYGSLNIVTHMDPEYDHNYSLEIDNGIILINYNIPDKKYLAIYFLILIADLFRIISEYTFRSYGIELKCWKREGVGEAYRIKNRPLSQLGKMVLRKIDEG